MENDGRRHELGKTIRTARERSGLSQRQLALMAGSNQSYIWEIETGRVSPSIDALCRIADALGCRVGDLIAF